MEDIIVIDRNKLYLLIKTIRELRDLTKRIKIDQTAQATKILQIHDMKIQRMIFEEILNHNGIDKLLNDTKHQLYETMKKDVLVETVKNEE